MDKKITIIFVPDGPLSVRYDKTRRLLGTKRVQLRNAHAFDGFAENCDVVAVESLDTPIAESYIAENDRRRARHEKFKLEGTPRLIDIRVLKPRNVEPVLVTLDVAKLDEDLTDPRVSTGKATMTGTDKKRLAANKKAKAKKTGLKF